MPPLLEHWPDRNQPFDISNSQAVSWLIAQPEIQQYIFDKFRYSHAILFDPQSQTWLGSATA